jgi:hypothetical protein
VQDPSSLFSIIAHRDLDQPVLIQALDGFVDAGHGRRLAREHLLSALDSEPIVRFDLDQLLDYRSRRPEMTFTTDHWDGYSQPELVIHLVNDLTDKPFLLLTGPEPDTQWERFIAAVGLVVEQLGVRLIVGLNAIPMGVPHTRPATVIAHALPTELVADYPKFLPTIQVPASIGNLIEYRLGSAGTPSCGFAVAVPHYLAHLEYPDAAAQLLECTAEVADLELPRQALVEAGVSVRENVDEQVRNSEDIANVVAALERQYDDLQSGRVSNLLADNAKLPTADELAAEFEKYLLDQSGPDETPADGQ